MNKFLRKLRGAIGVGLTWGILWALIAFVIGLVIGVVDPDSIDPGESPPIIAGIVGLTGFVCGLAFSAILSHTENRKTIRDLSPLRAAVWEPWDRQRSRSSPVCKTAWRSTPFPSA